MTCSTEVEVEASSESDAAVFFWDHHPMTPRMMKVKGIRENKMPASFGD
jgi:hypothetical protein